MKIIICAFLTAGISLALAGCSHHDNNPQTPVVLDTTPTYRSTVRSTDAHVEPLYTQPGLNSGPRVSMPQIPSQDRWDANDPLATRVYNLLVSDQGVSAKFLRVYAHKGNLWIQGSVSNRDQSQRAASVAKSIPGVKTVRNDLHVSI